MHPKIWDRLISNNYETKPFEIFGYARKALKARVYPALIVDETDSIRGLLYLNVQEEDLRIIDDFEGNEYTRMDLKSALSEEQASVHTYLYTGDKANLTTLDWDYEAFIKEHIVAFENGFEGWNIK